MKIIIAGAGEVGSHLAKMLASENHHLTIVDSDETRLLGVSDNADVVTILGHPTSIAVLQKANVAEADLFVAVYPDKEQDVNIVSAILAKQLGAKKVTARVNNDEYLHHENKFLFTDMGIDLLFYPEKSAAYEICDLLEQAEMSEFVGFAHGKLQFAVIRLELGSQMIDKTSAELLENDELLQFRVVAIA
ncbi:MAG: NAD-binding protein, partial [Bacteroidales bacterium]|nr:NAD-binding protein [Bacteroidales bacterium]